MFMMMIGKLGKIQLRACHVLIPLHHVICESTVKKSDFIFFKECNRSGFIINLISSEQYLTA